MPIHLLEVGPELDLKQLKKLSRRLAMTGGYEITLREDLEAEDLTSLIELHLPEIGSYRDGSSMARSNNSYRILHLVSQHPYLSETQRKGLLERLVPVAANDV